MGPDTMKSVPDPVLEVWPQIVGAFAHYGKRIGPNPSKYRRDLLQKRLDDGFSPDDLVRAVHGYVHECDGLDTLFSNGQRSGKYLRPKTVFKAEGFDERVEAGEGPWRAPKAFTSSRYADASDVMAEAKRRQAAVDAQLRLVEGQ